MQQLEPYISVHDQGPKPIRKGVVEEQTFSL